MDTTTSRQVWFKIFFLILCSDPVSYATDSFNLISGIPKLLSESTDMYINCSCFAIKIISPHMTEDLISCHDQSLIFHQILKKFKLFSCQIDLLPFPADLMLSDRQYKFTASQFLILFLPGTTAQNRFYSCNKFHQSKRFRNIVIRA